MKHWFDFKSYKEYQAYKKRGGKMDDEPPRKIYVKGGWKNYCPFEGCGKEISKTSKFCKEHTPSRKATEGVKEIPLNTVGLSHIKGKYECRNKCGHKVMSPKELCFFCINPVSKSPKYKTNVPKTRYDGTKLRHVPSTPS